MAESMGKPNSIRNRIKLLFGDKYTGEEDKTLTQTDGEKHKPYRQFTRSKSGRIKYRVRTYSSITDIDFVPAASENGKFENTDHGFNYDFERNVKSHSDRSALKTNLFKDVSKNEVTESSKPEYTLNLDIR